MYVSEYCVITWRSLIFGKGIPMVTTALALSSVKSSPSLTFPLHTAISRAPSGTQYHMMSGVKMRFIVYSWSQVQWSVCLTSSFTVFNCIVVGLKQLIKVTFCTTTRLRDHRFLLFQLLPQPRVAPAISQFIQHLIRQFQKGCVQKS